MKIRKKYVYYNQIKFDRKDQINISNGYLNGFSDEVCDDASNGSSDEYWKEFSDEFSKEFSIMNVLRLPNPPT